MEKKLRFFEAVAIVLAVICFTVIWFNLKSSPEVVHTKYEGFRPVPITDNDPNFIEWEDNFDTSYIHPITKCLVVTKK